MIKASLCFDLGRSKVKVLVIPFWVRLCEETGFILITASAVPRKSLHNLPDVFPQGILVIAPPFTVVNAPLPTWANRVAGRSQRRAPPPQLQRVAALFVSQLGWDVRVLPQHPLTPKHGADFLLWKVSTANSNHAGASSVSRRAPSSFRWVDEDVAAASPAERGCEIWTL